MIANIYQKSRSERSLKSTLALLMSLALVPACLESAAYMKLGDIKGEATDPPHKEWIEISSVSQGLSNDAGDLAGPPIFKDLKVIKRIDKSSPLLAQAGASGTMIEELELEIVNDVQDGHMPYMKYDLKKVMVTSFSQGANEFEDPMGIEEISLNYLDINWHYTLLSADGSIISKASAFWDLELNTGGTAISPVISQLGNQTVSLGESVTIPLIISDEDTPLGDLAVEASSDDPDLVGNPIVEWTGEFHQLSFKVGALYSGSAVVTVSVSDGTHSYWMSFTVLIDSVMSPFEGYLNAYFNSTEMLDMSLVSPIADPDLDELPTLLEFLLGSNPREYTPAEQQLKAAPRHIAPPDGVGDGTTEIVLRFPRRNDDPNVRLVLLGSFDGINWEPLNRRSGDNPMYKEKTNEGQNPLYDDVEGTVTPPSGSGPAFFIRLVGQMN